MYKLICKANKIAYINDELYYYIIRNNSITREFSLKALLDKIMVTDEMNSFITHEHPELSELCTMDKIRNVYRCHSLVCRYLNLDVFKNNTDLLKEYEFFKCNYKSVKNILNKYNFLYDVLFINRKLFYMLTKIKYKVKDFLRIK